MNLDPHTQAKLLKFLVESEQFHAQKKIEDDILESALLKLQNLQLTTLEQLGSEYVRVKAKIDCIKEISNRRAALIEGLKTNH